MTITKLYHRPDCTHIRDRETACNCTPPFPLELSKTEKPSPAEQSKEEWNWFREMERSGCDW
jgi:hypothetical protein